MKVSILLVPLLSVLLLNSIQAQLSLGIEGGFTKAWEFYNVELPEDAEIHVNGFNVHALAYLKFGKHLSLGIEPGYVQRGAACVPGFIAPIRGDNTFLLDYIEAPIMLKGKLPLLGEKLEIFGKLGYGASLMVSGILEVQPANEDEEPFREKLGERVRKLDHGAYGGLGLGINMGPGQLFLESDYYFGVPNAAIINRSENRSTNVNVGYIIEL